MAHEVAFQPFDVWTENQVTGGMNLSNDEHAVYLTDVTPDVAADELKADLAEIALGNGYAGFIDIQNTFSLVGKIYTMFGESILITASGGSIAQWQYIVLFNRETVVKVDPLLGFWDHEIKSNISIGQSHEILFNQAPVGSPGPVLSVLSFS